MKKLIIFLISFVILLSQFNIFALANFTDSFEVDAPIAYVISADSDATVIYDKLGNEMFDPGEIVKIVTAILVIENCTDLNEIVTASGNAIRSLEQIKVTRAGIRVDEQISVYELLCCLLIYNCSEASNVLAEYIGGSIDNFVSMMNEFSDKLGLNNTSFSNPGGYKSENQYSTASDIAKIMNYCIQNATFLQISSTSRYDMQPTNKYQDVRYLNNTNLLIRSDRTDYYFKYAKCGKSGETKSGLCNNVVYASKDGYNYICVVAEADDEGGSGFKAFVESKGLMKWVFDNIKLREVANTSTYVGEVKVRLADGNDYVGLVPANNVSALVPSGVNVESVLIEPIGEQTASVVDAPVKKGDKLGKAAIKYAGVTIAEVDLVASVDVDMSTTKLIKEKIRQFIVNPIFLIVVLLIVLFVIVCFIISYRNKQRMRRKRIRAIHKENDNIRRG